MEINAEDARLLLEGLSLCGQKFLILNKQMNIVFSDNANESTLIEKMLSDEKIRIFLMNSFSTSAIRKAKWKSADWEFNIRSKRIEIEKKNTSVPVIAIILDKSLHEESHFALLGKKIDALNLEIENRKNKEYELAEERKKKEQAYKAKDEFLANMSHEIRTPMNAIIGMADLLIDTPLTEEQKKYVNIFKKAGEHLLDIIDDILDFSKIESRQFQINNCGFNIKKLVNEVVEICSLHVLIKKLEITCRISQDVPEIIIGDQLRVKQVLMNLIGNSIKFTEKGRIEIDIDLNKNPNLKGDLYFKISDTGIGLSLEKQKSLFKPFFQGDSSITKKYGGTGLGLVISKKIVELMGGQIGVVSDEGIGSTFWFTLSGTPVNLVEDHSVSRPTFQEISKSVPSFSLKQSFPSIKEESFKNLKFLLVDDSEDNRLLITTFLKQSHCKIDEVENGMLAINKFKNEHYDVVLMDIQMPEMDGYTAVKEMRSWEKQKNLRPVLIIALTAYALIDEQKKSLEAGFDLHLSKPIKKDILIEAIIRLLKKNGMMAVGQ